MSIIHQFMARLKTDTGARGERVAAAWLCREKGFRVLARNWHSPRDRRDELDLVCMDGELLVFVEVKTRAAGGLVRGYASVNVRKKQALRRAVQAYLASLRAAQRPQHLRFDVVEVECCAGRPDEVLHIENVPLFSKRFGS
jgi:putative endonuclease